MGIKALSYVRVTGADLDAWDRYATAVLAVRPEREGDRMRLRLDERSYRFDLRAEGPVATVMGWDVATEVDLEKLRSTLDAAGVAVMVGDEQVVRDRDVLAQLSFTDPAGLEHEVVCGAGLDARAVHFSRALSSYRTGTTGLGHFAVGVPDLTAATAFYTGVLGFRVTDVMPGRFVFLRVNARHHSIALMQDDRAAIHHLLLEVGSIEDVGRALDAAIEDGLLRKSLGRHANDGVVSFYSRTPAGWEVELGTGGIRIDEDEWIVRRVGRPFSTWGHKPVI